jgi:hypothetical protein
MIEQTRNQLPHWAIGYASGNYMIEGAQLCTKDGRKIGNAFVNKVFTCQENLEIVTDMGNVVILNQQEAEELFYPPMYVMDKNKARGMRWPPRGEVLSNEQNNTAKGK